MSDVTISRWSGCFGLLAVICWLAEIPLWMIGSPPSVYDGAALGRYLFSIRDIALTRVLLDQGMYVALLVFAAGFRHLVRRANPDAEWIGTLAFGAMIIWLAVTLVADGLEGGAILDAMSGKADAAAVRALVEGTLLIYNGSIAFMVTALFLAAAGIATFATRILPFWTGVIATISAALCVACVPAMYFGAVDYTKFYNAGGWGATIIANIPPIIWFVVASVSMLLRPSFKTVSCAH